jgi:hypothetical protein
MPLEEEIMATIETRSVLDCGGAPPLFDGSPKIEFLKTPAATLSGS